MLTIGSCQDGSYAEEMTMEASRRTSTRKVLVVDKRSLDMNSVE